MSVECFVTGGSGFVGQHLLAHLTATGHKTWVLMRNPANIERLKEQVGQLGGNPAYLNAVEGDISRDGLGLSEADRQCVTSAAVVFHLAAQFTWGLTMEQARAVNVQGALRVARLAASQRIRLLMAGGYMLQNLTHLASIGVDNAHPENTNWPAVYGRVGGYEGSKLESHFAVIRYMQEVGADYSIVHPATVCGHSESGHIPEGQPLVDLIRNLALGRFKAVPGSARHWLPLVSVDYLVKMMTCVAFDPSMVNRQVLALYEYTPNLQGMLEQMAQTLDIEPPRRHVPIGLLKWLLAIPGLANRLSISAESLNFIQTQRFDMNDSQQLERKYQLAHPDMTRTLEKTVRYVEGYLPNRHVHTSAYPAGR
ncbi:MULTISPECIES: SDR family oxidoreductase [Pseudomonas]|uniref:NAD-dependent dehydratase n=3 Tax=Pseudomonas TaxID=286 RepID=A0A099MXW1_PSEDL|nr:MULTISPECIES: SDR family oxidoreductase [Pseudomonas]AHC82250.1 NAD dependent epimerase/dehydratase [Pseudomonas monteilii SB3078]AHC87628.1 NAD dependent epimerase/dehydratase [Pseudomonas monteilii SB3101]AHZ77063.1 NAD-dependent epimerase/dehydratase / Alpha/beta hydrolase [Pseudomonas putida]AJG14044.1 NAD dependent epimerase/dehydratase [Pseudomonas plecoglossicida]ESW41356.1 NAD dependent epimerase/dehydratase [Pseudomonas taiwanensis SJ9]